MRLLNTARRPWGSNRCCRKAVVGLAALFVVLAHAACRRESSLGVLKFVSPEYPGVARLYHLAGRVNVTVQVGPDGRVVNAKGSGSAPVLVEAAERNVALWQFHVPNKGPYPVVGTIVFDFMLTGKPSTQGLTTVEFTAPNHVNVVDQPAYEDVPQPIPAEGIEEPPSRGPGLLQMFRDCYSKHCANQATGPIDQVPLRELIDCYSKHCEQELKDMVAQEKANQLRAREKQRPGSGPK